MRGILQANTCFTEGGKHLQNVHVRHRFRLSVDFWIMQTIFLLFVFNCGIFRVNTIIWTPLAIFLEGIEHFSLPITIRFGRVIPVSCFTHQHHEVMRQGADEPSPKSNSVRGNIFNSIQTLARNEFQIQGSKTLNVHTLQNCSYDPWIRQFFFAWFLIGFTMFYHTLMSIHPSHSHPILFWSQAPAERHHE